MKNWINHPRKDKHLWFGIIFLFVIPFILFFIFLGLYINYPSFEKSAKILISVLSAVMIFSVIYLVWYIHTIIKNNTIIKNTLNYHVENEVGKEGIGIIIFNDKLKIIWISKFIRQRFGETIISKNLRNYFDISNWDDYDNKHEFRYGDFVYDVNLNLGKNVLLLRDITLLQNTSRLYENEKTVFGEIEIDSMQLYQSIYSEEEIFKIYNSVVDVLDDLSKKYNFIYRRYLNTSFFIITTEESLKKLVSLNFKDLTQIKSNLIGDKQVKVPISAGFASGEDTLEQLSQKAKEALSQSQSRGGDQITVIYKNYNAQHFGSTSEIAFSTNRTKISYITKLFINKLQSNSISKVIVYGHKLADLDAIGSAYAIAKIAKYYKKEVFIQNKTFDQTGQKSVNTYLSKKNIFISPKQATKLNDDKTLVVVVDCVENDRVENPNAFKNISPENIFIFDHHRISKTPEDVLKQNIYVDTGASSASEIITELIMFSNNSKAISKEAAQMLLDGIYMDTNRFLKTTSSKTFLAASFLESLGASSAISIETLKMDESVHEIVSNILQNLQEVKPGYFLATYDKEAESDVVAIAAEEILRIQGRKAAFVIAKVPGQNRYKLSARGIDTNVQIIAEAVNGGGHFGAAAAISDEKEPINIFVDNIIQAIVSVKDESNYN
ncbi:DHH family phosphoesterase [[Mycoplasma] gypis]|uniref:DHH family phosphoesterase n=1 Tax=[Mycoplasma] gypis TaxID=92404 RepID=A0ABZ2RMG5_9BACT|nr:DHH family phosphoesterase [[Mycoplasma] gypis]MBN0919099.1 DHH family phosphoesterase [[Mycoplasma] gypis]